MLNIEKGAKIEWDLTTLKWHKWQLPCKIPCVLILLFVALFWLLVGL